LTETRLLTSQTQGFSGSSLARSMVVVEVLWPYAGWKVIRNTFGMFSGAAAHVLP